MRPIDERFLRPHPRTVLWQEQRKKCEACSNLLIPEGEDSGMRCSAVKMVDVVNKKHTNRFLTLAKGQQRLQELQAFCIDAREPGAPCGPDAILFRLSLLDRGDAAENSTVGKTDSSQKGNAT